MYSMVLMAALTTGTDMPDGRRGGRGGCCGCYGGMAYGGGYGGCFGRGYGGCMGMGYGGGFGGCMGMGFGGGCGGYRMGYGGGGGRGYGGYVLGGASPWVGGYASAPMISNYGTPIVMGTPTLGNAGLNQSFFFNPSNGNQTNQATIIVHLPANATLTIDGQPTQSTSGTRTFTSPPLEPGKTYTYTLRAEMNRDGRPRNVKKNIDVRAGQPTEVTLNFDNANRDEEQLNAPPPDEQSTTRKRVPPPDR